jgi:hypothetical protein
MGVAADHATRRRSHDWRPRDERVSHARSAAGVPHAKPQPKGLRFTFTVLPQLVALPPPVPLEPPVVLPDAPPMGPVPDDAPPPLARPRCRGTKRGRSSPSHRASRRYPASRKSRSESEEEQYAEVKRIHAERTSWFMKGNPEICLKYPVLGKGLGPTGRPNLFESSFLFGSDESTALDSVRRVPGARSFFSASLVGVSRR